MQTTRSTPSMPASSIVCLQVVVVLLDLERIAGHVERGQTESALAKAVEPTSARSLVVEKPSKVAVRRG